VPRSRLDTARVVEEAARIADADGLAEVTLVRVAESLGVRAPSLYNHVEGVQGMLRLLTILSFGELTEAIRNAAVGRSRASALTAVAHAYRAYAHEHAGCFAATVRASATGDAELSAAGLRPVEVIAAVIDAWGFTGDDAVKRILVIRSALHGFNSLEAAGAFGFALDVDQSFELMLQTLVAGLEMQP
jgi:AcrR family transcriptional regulator